MAMEPGFDMLRDLEEQTKLWNRYEKKPNPRLMFANNIIRAHAI